MKNTTAIILLVLSVVLFFSFTNIQYRDVKILSGLSGEYRNVLRNVSAIVELRDRLLVAYETLPRSEIERLNKALPDNVDTVRLALDLDGMASRYGIAIRSVQTTTGTGSGGNLIVLPERASPLEKAIVSFRFVANYDNFMLMLADIEKSLRLMDIKSISFQASDSGLYEYQIVVETYWLKAALAAADAPSQNVGDDLLRIFAELERVTLGQELFSTPSYLSLSDFGADIPEQTTGRPNPFDLIGRD